jgi:hypothetical protein
VVVLTSMGFVILDVIFGLALVCVLYSCVDMLFIPYIVRPSGSRTAPVAASGWGPDKPCRTKRLSSHSFLISRMLSMDKI